MNSKLFGLTSKAQDWWRTFRLNILLGNVQVLAADGRYELALQTMARPHGTNIEAAPSRNLPLIVNILYSDMCQRLGKMREAFDGCQIALGQIGDEYFPNVERYSEDEIKYLRFRCKWILTGVSRFVDSIALETALSIDVTSRDFELSKVRPRIRRLFPMSEKDGTAFDMYMEENRDAMNG